MKTMAIIALALIASPLKAESVVSKIGPVRLAANTVATGLDMYSTGRCMHKFITCEEKGPIMKPLFGKRISDRELVGGFLINEALYIGGSYLIGETLGYDSPVLDAFQITSIGSHGIAATLNFKIKR